MSQAEATAVGLIRMFTLPEMSAALFQLGDKEIELVFKILLGITGGVHVICELLTSMPPVRSVRFLYPSNTACKCVLDAEVSAMNVIGFTH